MTFNGPGSTPYLTGMSYSLHADRGTVWYLTACTIDDWILPPRNPMHFCLVLQQRLEAGKIVTYLSRCKFW